MTILPTARGPRVLAGCAVCARVATRGERSLHTHPKPPRSLLAALRSSAGASPAHTPAPAGPLLHRATAPAAACVLVDIAAHHSAGAAEQRIAPVDDGVKASAAQPP
jgi:hypothetical protein